MAEPLDYQSPPAGQPGVPICMKMSVLIATLACTLSTIAILVPHPLVPYPIANAMLGATMWFSILGYFSGPSALCNGHSSPGASLLRPSVFSISSWRRHSSGRVNRVYFLAITLGP
jgi:hypothetical protein